ncbi:MAG: Glyceraldehyde 3-phosphate dehydrogenase [Candidatus Giovannonibacteria bacterium GW2011_GWA2_44_13b]|uniref:Glyceraldehyde 3-phosphate dehydrogenase n=1 Tax=Candidatus Giovannonibacteria bacterium GW2011_GWA2_44_13b TaxID=1618647 RepID=A0A0G1GXC0_9BACT|nr:MAG: Glyceraldehyde 3-phosphate dehydrogenase [Candidatus Giovannonibacteria bacterium GW2011_GWA2_44_13b]
MTKIAINGFGRIGRSFFRATFGDADFEIGVINDLTDPKTLAYLLKYDSVYGRYKKDIKVDGNHLVIDGQRIEVVAEKDPTKLPWDKMGVDIVVESTGFFATAEKAKAHLDAGAKRVVITAPATGEAVTALVGVNDDVFKKNKNPITCNASCTTNSVSPVMKIILDNFGVKKAAMTTVHGYTATQKLVDGPDAKDPRRGRAAAANIVPSTTGAAEAVIQTIPELIGKFQAESVRVPTLTGSLSIMTVITEKKTSVEEINEVFREAVSSPRWKKTLKVTEDPIVSTDIIGEPYGAIVDMTLTRTLGDDLIKIFSWYDNEAGYTATLVEHVRRIAGNI